MGMNARYVRVILRNGTRIRVKVALGIGGLGLPVGQ